MKNIIDFFYFPGTFVDFLCILWVGVFPAGLLLLSDWLNGRET